MRKAYLPSKSSENFILLFLKNIKISFEKISFDKFEEKTHYLSKKYYKKLIFYNLIEILM